MQYEKKTWHKIKTKSEKQRTMSFPGNNTRKRKAGNRRVGKTEKAEEE